MTRPGVAACALAAGIAVLPDTAIHGAQAPTVDDALKLAASYVERYERRISAIVAQEDYQQAVLPTFGSGSRATTTRKTRAYILTIDLKEHGWVAFRDVFDLDGRPVREREERLTRILQNVTPDSLDQARRIAAESARYNLNPSTARIARTINVPMTALLYLRAVNQPRSAFRLGKSERIDGSACATLTFAERARPRLIRTDDDSPAQGTFWIDLAAGGRVVKTEMHLESSARRDQFVRSQISVKYAPVDKLDLWLPAVMDESYEVLPTRQLLTAHAVYSDFREFTVSTGEVIK